MKLGPLTIWQRRTANGRPISGRVLLALHWPWSLTWRFGIDVDRQRTAPTAPFAYFMRTYRYRRGLNFMAGINVPLLGSLTIATQPNMRKREFGGTA